MKASFLTFGCKINFYDTQALREAVYDLGYEEAAAGDSPDLLVVNACTVTERAGGKAVATVKRLAGRHPEAAILVTGCMTEDDRDAIESVDGVAWLVGNEEKDQIPALVQGAKLRKVKGRRSRAIFDLKASRFDTHTRAFLKVHDGCDEFCTYCIIPFLRGKSKSRPIEDVLAEATRFAEAGHKELVITGIHLSRYGRDLALEDGLIELLQALRRIPGVERVRLSSIGEGAFSDAFLAAFVADPGLCPFFHVPLQSGSDSVLRRMRRDYTAAEFLDAIKRVRSVLPRAVIATDLMVGFPGETEEEFEQSLETCRRAAFAKMHMFPYSPRPGTKAAKLPDPVPPPVKRERMARARDLEARLIETARREWIGREVQVLVERRAGDSCRGLSREGIPVRFHDGTSNVIDRWNEEVSVSVTGFDGEVLTGVPSEQPVATR